MDGSRRGVRVGGGCGDWEREEGMKRILERLDAMGCMIVCCVIVLGGIWLWFHVIAKEVVIP